MRRQYWPLAGNRRLGAILANATIYMRDQALDADGFLDERRIGDVRGPMTMTFVRARCHDYYRKRPTWKALLYFQAKLLAGHTRHLNIRYQEARLLGVDFLKRFNPIAGGYNFISRTLQAEFQNLSDCDAIVSYYYALSHYTDSGRRC
jgi:hypothetical protein